MNTIAHRIRKDKKRKDGSYRVYLQVISNRKSRYIGTDIIVTDEQWNQSKGIVKKKHPFSKQLNRRLEVRLNKARAEKLRLEQVDRFSLDEFANAISGNNEANQLRSLIDEYYANIEDTRYYEHRRFGVLRNQLYEYIGDDKVTLEELNSGFVEGFRDFLLHTIGNNNNTVRRKLRSFKRFTNFLLKNEIIEKNPFQFVAPPKVSSTKKVKLSYEQIQKIENLELNPRSKLWHARNYFLYSFYNAGIRHGDLCTLTWNNIVDGRLHYTMRKTGKIKSVKQSSNQLNILRLYGYPEVNYESYIFPILNSKYDSDKELKKKISSENVMQNNRLRKIASRANIETNITTHIARHSFAQYALENGVSIYSISKAMGHSDISTTAQYLKSFDEELLDDEMNELFTN